MSALSNTPGYHMGRPQDWCYSCYEIPPRGVSSDNPAGHLLMAMRNRDERPNLSAAFMRLQAVAGFSYASDQSLLSGVLSILPWQLIFVPCVNSAEVEWPTTNLVRQTIMQTLRPIEPGFQRSWASGIPGTIALAKVDCVLAVDRHSRVYRFDPIIKRWSATTDGVKPTVSGLLNGSSSDVPHTPHRLLILTTDLEVYGFRLCKPNMVASESGDYQLISSESESKKLVKSFIRNLTTTVAHIRSSTGIELAVEYFNHTGSYPPFTERTTQQHLDLTVSPKSIDPFKPPVDTILDQCFRPINRNPVHPIHRLHQNWDHFNPDDCVWVENTKFSFCRTYPLRVPSVPLKRVVSSVSHQLVECFIDRTGIHLIMGPRVIRLFMLIHPLFEFQLLGARTYFEGNRFPMLSYLYKKNAALTEQNPPPNVWVLRSGHVESSVDVRTIINCDTPPHVLPIRLVHIQLDETSFKDLSGSLIDSSQANLRNFRSRSTSDVLTRNISSNNGFESPSRWFVPTLKDSHWRFIPRTNEKQLRVSVRPPDTDVQDCQDCSSNMSWPTPSAKTVEQAWVKLGNLARLPQLHIPSGERETPNLSLSKSQVSINTLDDFTGYSKRHLSTVQSSAGSICMTPEVTRRNLVGHRPSSPSLRLSTFSVTYPNDSEEKSSSHSVSNNLKHGVPLQRKLSSVAAECSPHRSSWNDHFNATRWMALLSASLDQAVRLADCVRHLASYCRTANSGYYLLISGPGSGRTWQAIITSLLQDCSSNMSWPTPSAKTVEQAWVKLGNLARLPQLHIPSGERETPNLSLSKSQVSINTLDDFTGYSKRHLSTVQSSAGSICMTPEVTRRNLVGHRPSSPSLRLSTLSVTYPNDSEEKSSSHSVPNNLKHGVPLQRKLSSVAAECSPHRSSWNDHFNATRWMALLSASLDQAVRLADCVRHLASYCRTANSGYYLLISGPGSGRTWQAIITSLLQVGLPNQIILSPETRTLSGFEDLIEHEWVRAGYPFAPDPSDWYDSSVSNDYDSCASFALFLDCVHQLLLQFPVDFGFTEFVYFHLFLNNTFVIPLPFSPTEDYLVFLLDTALSRGGGLPPFAIEFSCSCDAARCVSNKAKSPRQVAQQSDELCRKGVLRSFRDWANVLTDRGLALLPNWRYWWYWHLNPTEIKDTDHALMSTFSPPFRIMPELFPTVSPASYLRCWVHGWFRWNRSLRLAAGGGYAFGAAISRSLLGPPKDEPVKELHRTKTSTSPYTGWLSDEAIEAAESLFDENFLDFLNSNSVAPLIRLVSDWELLPDLASQP
ncbi:hypothetical protein T265_00496 [Opisthorchis viverrini]|uniref:Myotubularin phosphatase domain-containing protein n=1 Tax=Opisthorchis viverrini TaxID=6198 RepID=A0A075A2L7_OPIVI|nr:hypothetical protein T265_00496 [Opisthorchis viverrini]KER33601.1 hypothetical protein T265_00496 [Opisthorchis viverrini]